MSERKRSDKDIWQIQQLESRVQSLLAENQKLENALKEEREKYREFRKACRDHVDVLERYFETNHCFDVLR